MGSSCKSKRERDTLWVPAGHVTKRSLSLDADLRTDGIECHKAIVSKLFHDCRLLQECGCGHGALTQGFHSHIDAVAPFAVEHFTKVAATQFTHQLYLRPWYLILIAQLWAQIPHLWLWLGTGTRQNVTQAKSVFWNTKKMEAYTLTL